MSYEPKRVDSEPPQYGAQSPPPVSQPTEIPLTNKSQPMSPPPGQMSPSHPVQYQSQPQMGQVQSPQPAHYGQNGDYVSQPQQGYQQQQQYRYPQQQQHQPPAQGITMPIASLTSSPAPIKCPSCGAQTMTTTTQKAGNTTHGWAAAICCCFCLGCIPYLMSSLKDVEHRCAKCGVHLATWHKSGRTDVKLHG